MAHKKHLETRIREIYSFIREHHKIIDVSSRPEEKHSSQQRIQQHWIQIERYLRDYLTICQYQQTDIPEDIEEIIAARFPDLPESIMRNVSSQEPKLPSLATFDDSTLFSLRELRLHHQIVQEWKELHNLIQEVITSLTPLIGAFELAFYQRGPWNKALGLQLWRQARIQLRRLESFSRDIKYIDEPFDDAYGSLSGAGWMVEIATLQYELDSGLREGEPSFNYDLAIELSDACFTQLYRADKYLRDAVGEICTLSDVLLRSIENGE